MTTWDGGKGGGVCYAVEKQPIRNKFMNAFFDAAAAFVP